MGIDHGWNSPCHRADGHFLFDRAAPVGFRTHRRRGEVTTNLDLAPNRIQIVMPKITLIGAGSMVFTRNLCSDILLAPSLQDCTISLMDIDSQRLEQSRQIAQSIATRRKL